MIDVRHRPAELPELLIDYIVGNLFYLSLLSRCHGDTGESVHSLNPLKGRSQIIITRTCWQKLVTQQSDGFSGWFAKSGSDWTSRIAHSAMHRIT